ncbi:MAG: HAMP domain-containing protein [Deltaproteobacteria bacterium]|nr:HAMP domain-containing protein [Deltaproteobacteria bacterium]
MREVNDPVDVGKLRKGLFQSLATRMIVCFSLLFVVVLFMVQLVGIFGVPFTSFTGRRGQWRAEAFRTLNLIADTKKQRLLLWIKERRGDVHVFSENELTSSNVVELRSAVSAYAAQGRGEAELWALVRKEKSYSTLLEFMENVRTAYGVPRKIVIADAETGTIIVSTDNADPGRDVSHQDFFTKALKDDHEYVCDIKINHMSQSPFFHISHIIKDREGKVVGVAVLEIDADDFIRPMLHTGEGLGKRGEALLVNEDGRILIPLKHPLPDGTRARPLEYRIKTEPAVLAARGEEGIIEAVDYRGEQVLAAYRHIRLNPDWGWGMVVKRDRAELFAPLQQDIYYSFLTSLTGVLALIWLTFVTARRLTGQLRSLSLTADKVARGDLDARAPVTALDEVGQLAMTFNSMAQRIQTWHKELEAQVAARTDELKEANEELRRENAERVRAERALQNAREDAESIVDTLREPLVVLDADLRVISANRSFYRTFKAIPEETEGQLFYEMGNRQWDIPGLRKLLEEVIPANTAFEDFEVEDEFPAIGRRIMFLNARRIYREANKTEMILLAMEDVTERVRAERALKDYSERLEEMVEERTKDLRDAQDRLLRHEKLAVLGQLASGVGHELRNPLGVIANSTYYLGMKLKDADEKVRKHLDILRREVKRSNEIITDLLDFSRAKPSSLVESDVNSIIKHALSGSLVPENITVETRLDEKLPGIPVDPDQIRRVFLNILSNAVQAMPEGGRLEISSGAEEDFVEITVKDTGEGIAEENLQKIFDALFTTKAKGIGLGLAIVKSIIDGHKGTIEVKSEVGEGAIFTIRLPLQREIGE